MEVNQKKEKTARRIQKLPFAVLGLTAAALVGIALYGTWIYMHGHEIEDDKTAGNSNINVMLSRPEGWHKIDTGDFTLDRSDIKRIDGSTATIPITAELVRQFLDAPDEAVRNLVNHNTTDWAYQYLSCPQKAVWSKEHNIDDWKQTDIIFVTEPSADEWADANNHGVSLSVTPIALDGFVFITHRDNPVNSLTADQIRRIYSGEITNWKEVGGNDEEIIPYQRERNSGSQTALEQLVMKDTKIMTPKVGYTIEGMGSLIEHIAEYENAQNSLGYTYYYYLSNLYRSDDVKVLAVDGVLPDNEHLISKEYPFTTAYYAVVRGGEGGKAAELRDWLLTDKGQELIALAGYCPVKE